MPKLKRERTAPFITSNESVRTIMLDVLIALLPALAWAVYTYGLAAIKLVAVSVGVSVACDLVMSLIVRKRLGVTDLSALVTGVVLAFTLPYDAPVYVAAAGAAFAIIVAKGAFGGLGKNLLNPALCGRVFVHFAFGAQVNTAELARGTDVLDTLRAGDIPDVHFVDMFMGDMGGAMGEISALLLLAGGVYLILRGTSDWRISAAFIASAGVMAYLLCPHYDKVSWVLGQVFAGAFMLGALFMIAEPASSPVTPVAKLVYGAVGGALVIVFRMYLPISDGVYFAILAANVLARPIEELALPSRNMAGKKRNK